MVWYYQSFIWIHQQIQPNQRLLQKFNIITGDCLSTLKISSCTCVSSWVLGGSEWMFNVQLQTVRVSLDHIRSGQTCYLPINGLDDADGNQSVHIQSEFQWKKPTNSKTLNERLDTADSSECKSQWPHGCFEVEEFCTDRSGCTLSLQMPIPQPFNPPDGSVGSG